MSSSLDTARTVSGLLRSTPAESGAVSDSMRIRSSAGIAGGAISTNSPWKALPDGSPMPTLKDGSSGDAVRSLQDVHAALMASRAQA